MHVLVGRVTAVDRVARTLSFGPTTIRLPESLSLTWIVVGRSVLVVYEELDGALIATDVRQP
jgi:hypothetical protein